MREKEIISLVVACLNIRHRAPRGVSTRVKHADHLDCSSLREARGQPPYENGIDALSLPIQKVKKSKKKKNDNHDEGIK